MLECWRKALDNDELEGALLTELSKHFYLVNEEYMQLYI